ncbi:TPA: hypothetical protein HA241_00860 [Candidatus Woesearchaeota archaeon]|nr:hypothetical protein [Candidatus Woesearchaeota archaeon]
MDTGEPIPGATPPEAIKPPVVATPPEKVQPVNPLVEQYQSKAQELKIKPVQGGEWMATDGVEYIQWGDEKRQFASNTDEQTFPTRLNQVGTYDSNNGTLAFVDEKGMMHAGHSTDANFQALEQAGYRRGGIWVPFSNGEVPTDPELRKQYTELREKGREINKKTNIERHLRVFSETAERKGIKPVEGGLFMTVDGIEYRHGGNETGAIDTNTDGYNMAIRRVEQVGTYDSNNGRMAFVDEQGRMWLGASTDENYEAIRKVGYTSGGIWVPFSNGEMPTDRATYEQLRDVLTGKRAEQLKAERTARVEEIIEGRKVLFGDIAVLPDNDELFAKVADRAERQYVNEAELVKEKLQPRTEKDDAGFERSVYTINGVTFSFKGREELPTYQTLTSSRTTLLGEAPNWAEAEDYQKYQEQLKQTQTQEGSPQHFVANKTLLGTVELAMQLGSKDSSLPQLREELAKGIYSPRALTLLDALVASNYGDSIRYGGRPENQAEAVVLLSLLGDGQAQTAVAENVESLREYETSKQAHRERRKIDDEPLKPQELCVVHATRYKPEATEDGGFLIPTTFDATKGKVLRNTVHTALNHKVAGHMYGSWGDAGYVVISPFEKMMEANGVPTVLNTIDTYWATNPGEPLVFSNGTLVAPGGAEVQGLYQQEGNVVKFKSAGLDRQDLINLAKYSRQNGYQDDFSRSIDEALSGALHPYGSAMELAEQWDFSTTQQALNQFLYHDSNSYGHQPALLSLLTAEIEGQPESNIETRLKNLIEQSGATSGLKPEVTDKDGAITTFAKTLTDRIRSTMFSEINELTVRETIRARGFTVKPGGMWAWDDSWTVTAETGALGEELGVPVGAHSNMVDHTLTERFSGAISQATEGERGKGKFNWTKYNSNYDDLVRDIDPKTRRVLYASGLLTARG